MGSLPFCDGVHFWTIIAIKNALLSAINTYIYIYYIHSDYLIFIISNSEFGEMVDDSHLESDKEDTDGNQTTKGENRL